MQHHNHKHNHNSTRRSPRFSLSPHQPHPSRGERKQQRNQNQKQSLALALHNGEQATSEQDPQPLNIYHPIPNKPLLLTASSSSSKKTPRRSTRLMAASIGVTNGKCGSAMLLKLSDSSEKKACQLARACLDESDFNVRCLRSGNVPVPSHLAAATACATLAPSSGKRKHDARYDVEESVKTPANRGYVRRSARFSGENSGGLSSCKELGQRKSARKSEELQLALPSSSIARKSGHFKEISVNVESRRRSSRFSGDKIVGNGGKSKSENLQLALVSSSMAENSAKSSKVEKNLNGEQRRRSSRFSGEKLGDSSSCKEVIAENRGKSARKWENVPRSTMADNSAVMAVNGGSRRRLSRFSSSEFVDSSPCKEVIAENGRKLGRKSENLSLMLSISSTVEKSSNSAEMAVTGGSRRRSSRFSGSEFVNSSPCKELIAENGGKSAEKSENFPLALLSSSMAVNGESRRRSSRFSGEPPACKGLTDERIESKPSKKSEELISSPKAENLEEIEEEKVLRRSPRGLASISLVDDYECEEMKALSSSSPKTKKKVEKKKVAAMEKSEEDNEEEEEGGVGSKSENCFLVGEAVPEEEAHQKWGWRYQKNRRVKSRSLTTNLEEEGEPNLKVKCHYTQAQINGCIFHLGDCALIRGEGGEEHIGRIMEFLRTMEGEEYFRVQWFYKAEDTVMKKAAAFHDKRRIFYSTIMNDNLLNCIISKLNVAQVTPQLNLTSSSIPPSDFYYNMEYCLEYSTFRNLPRDITMKSYELPSLGCPQSVLSLTRTAMLEDTSICEPCNAQLNMLDLYAGCGAMSTGLCVGARISGVNLVTRWAIDCDSSACESLRLNHPETHVKNEDAEEFLELLKHWEKLCKKFVTGDGERSFPSPEDLSDGAESGSNLESNDDVAADELEVSTVVDICYGDTGELGKRGLKFKVRWKGHGPSEDTWEPIDGLSNCQELIQDFVLNGYNNKILPLPGDVDVICGGPPCQGISGYNRFRCVDDPLADERNRQLVIFMDIVEYLKPKFVLMENVTDILRFDKASLGRYALSRLVHMHYQARVGIMAAGCYGLPQFRLRVFFWGALPSEELPQFPLPTHDVVVRYWPPPEFERNVVAYEEGHPPELEGAVFLRDAISDLPAVTNYESLDEMPYNGPPETEFQKYIRSTIHEMIGSTRAEEAVLYDHRPHQLFEDDYIRVCQIPRRKGANFRDLPGIVVGDDNVVRRDPTKEPVRLPSGMPLAPEYVFTFEQGKSKRPFARLWWDETMPTVVTYPNCHSQAILHPEQDRVLTVRECARLQGFPDNYRFCGTVKKRYRQVGNAVAVPVAKALGYALGMASQKLIGKEPLITLPPKFTYS